MARARSGYSRFVAWAKVILPLTALALLATMFLIARRIDPDAAIPHAEVDVRQYAREARIGAPEFSSVTADGTVVAATAEVARPDPQVSGKVQAERVTARFDVPDGSRIDAESLAGTVDSPADLLDLVGEVKLRTSTGYDVSSERMTATLGFTEIHSPGPVTAVGPPGRIDAGSMVVTQTSADPSRYSLVFKGGVKLVYEPSK